MLDGPVAGKRPADRQSFSSAGIAMAGRAFSSECDFLLITSCGGVTARGQTSASQKHLVGRFGSFWDCFELGLEQLLVITWGVLGLFGGGCLGSLCGGITVRQREAGYSHYGDRYERHGRPDIRMEPCF